MKRCSFVILFLFPVLVYSQKVGLVFSGGGAKGIAHIGVLKALEENEIPIDYIVGTSMGGIIAGCYAAGLSPTQIEQLVVSEKFLRWINGLPEKGFNYYYRQPDQTPGFIKFTLDIDSTLNFRFNSSIASDVSLNFALAEKMAQASAISKNNFDSLLIPLRVVAADIFTQNQIILSNGSLSDALRSTQTVPFFYKPIRVAGKYLFDGGLYNNFPVDVVQHDFNPDVIIGSNVSSKIFDQYPYDKDEQLISHSLLYLLLDKSDPKEIPEQGIYIQPNLKGYTAYDFTRIRQMIDSGYLQTIRQMPEIKRKISERQTCEGLAEKRNAFNSKNKPFVFNDLSFQGFNAKQRSYMRRIFKTHKGTDELIRYSDIKKGYFRLVSEEYFSNVHPNIFFDEKKNAFNLQLSSRPQQNFQLDFGGVIASRNISNIFVGLNYYYFGRTLTHISATTQNGSFYKAAALKVRLDFPTPFYLEPYISFDNWNYLENDDLIQEVTETSTPTVLKRTNRKFALRVGLPVQEFFKSVFYIEGFNNEDRYINGNVFISTDVLDRLQLVGFKTGINLASNTLDRKQYPSSGSSFSLTGDYFNAEEYFDPGTTSVEPESIEENHQWFRLKGSAEQYFGRGKYHYGYLAEAVFSNQPAFQNYFGTIINTPAFMPLQDSRTLILQNFRSFNYTALGIRNVFSIVKKLDLRIEAYLFKPFDYLQQNTEQEVTISHDLKKLYKAATAGLVYHTPVGPASLSFNYYDDDENQLGLLFHVGFLLYNKHSLE